LKIIITGRNIELTPPLKEFAEKKMESIKTYVEQLQEIDMILSVEKTKNQGILHTAEVTVWAKGINFRATQSHPDMYAAMDLILDKLQKQIGKYKDKLKAKPNRKHKQRDFHFKHQVFNVPEAPVLTQAEELSKSEPMIVRSNNFFSKPMFVDEAADQLKCLQQEFIVFSNAQSGEVNVVYRRNDGNIGLIEPHAR
jgi:putative sigma-54 modulation protein